MDNHLKESIAEELNVDPEELKPDTKLRDLEYWDSVMVLSIMVILSEGLGREISVEEMTNLETFGDIEALAAGKSG